MFQLHDIMFTLDNRDYSNHKEMTIK